MNYYYLAAAGRLFAVFAFGGCRATFSRFWLAVMRRCDAGGFIVLRRFCVFYLRFAAGGRLFIFCDVCVGVSGVRFARFAVFSFGGGRAVFHN